MCVYVYIVNMLRYRFYLNFYVSTYMQNILYKYFNRLDLERISNEKEHILYSSIVIILYTGKRAEMVLYCCHSLF